MIQILTTGGTIEGVDNNNPDPPEVNVTICQFLKNANVSFEYKIESLFKKDSRVIDSKDRKLLVQIIKDSNESKILITHGTFTMEDTAKYIGKLNLNKTIVLVGSLVLGSHNNTDASFNLGYAISSLQYLEIGVYIAMNGQVFHWKNVYKNRVTNKFERNE
jgi:L-asparaginase